jgi:methionyl-tRNA formyltransferase
MKYIYFGTPDFAADVLQELINANMPPVAVVTNPDRPSGRKKIITPPAVKELVGRSVSVLQPEELDQAFAQQLESFGADVFVLAAYGKILPKWVVEMPKKGMVGVHPSLLPKYRGATPIQSVILAGEKETGTSLFIIDEEIDHGPILAQEKLTIESGDNYLSLSLRLAKLSGQLLIKALPKYVEGEIAPHVQDHDQATLTSKFKTEDAEVDLEKDDAVTIWRKVRALNPEPGTYTIRDGKRMKILEADLEDDQLILKKIQFAGEKPKDINEKI